MDLLLKLLFICPMLFIAGIVDGISGGGGIIALPTYLFAGLPVNLAYGCNKLQSCLGTCGSLYKYSKDGFADHKAGLLCSVTTVIGSFSATRIMLVLPENIQTVIICVMMCFIISLTFLIGKVRSGEFTRVRVTKENIIRFLAIGMTIGLYDGFFGPGGSTVAMMLLSLIFGYDIRCANGTGKIMVVVSNLTAVVNYALEGSILYTITVPATISNILGSYIGASIASKKGMGIVRIFTVLVVIIVVIQGVTKLL